LASKLHNWCIQAIVLLLEIRDIDIQVVFELCPFFSTQKATKPLEAALCTAQTPSWLIGVGIGKGKERKGRKRDEGRTKGRKDGHPECLNRGCPF